MMDCFPQWIMAFDSLWTTERVLGLYVLFNAFVQSLPDPDERSSVVYIFVFRFSHAIAMNINVVRKPVKTDPSRAGWPPKPPPPPAVGSNA